MQADFFCYQFLFGVERKLSSAESSPAPPQGSQWPAMRLKHTGQ